MLEKMAYGYKCGDAVIVVMNISLIGVIAPLQQEAHNAIWHL